MKFSLKYRGVGHYVLLFCINSTSGYKCSYPMIVNGWPQSHHKSMSGFFFQTKSNTNHGFTQVVGLTYSLQGGRFR